MRTKTARRSLAAAMAVTGLVLIWGCKPAPPPETQGPVGTRPGELPVPIQPPTEEAIALELTSSAFAANETIPAKHTADGEDVSPPLSWVETPAGTVELALIVDDPDAPAGTWTHWVLWGLGADARELPEGVPTTETVPTLRNAKQGKNDFGKIGYGGPSPPPGPAHRYNFTLYALDASVSLAPGAGKADLLAAMEGHILGKGTLTGMYGR